MTVLDVAVPPFDPADERFDGGPTVFSPGYPEKGARPDRETGMKSSKRTLAPVTPW
jgi:hypothetical protein